MDNEPLEPIVEEAKSNHSTIVVAVLVALLIVVSLAWLFVFNANSPENPDLTLPPEIIVPTEGVMLMSDAGTAEGRSVIKGYDVGNERVISLEAYDDGVTYQRFPVHMEGSLADATIAYLGAPYDPTSGFYYPYSEYLDLHIASPSGTTVVELPDLAEMRDLQYSEAADLFAFSAIDETLSEEEFDRENLNHWGIYIMERDGNPRMVAQGVSPKWSASGDQLLHLRSDGLYSYDVSTELLDAVLIDANWVVQYRDVFAMTDDQVHIVISDIGFGGFHIHTQSNTRPDLYYYQGFTPMREGTIPKELLMVPGNQSFVIYKDSDLSNENSGALYELDIRAQTHRPFPNGVVAGDFATLSDWID
ncbi:MAG: hypothetical protein AAGA35_02465 [Patescibacteria group bacterium]